jgi:hypothetical protein
MSGRDPFPGLRPFEEHESDLYFGRDEQCDDLLSRLARRRLVAVVGMSGSGKSSLVRAGLLPALDRGYLPSAGSSWHVAVFRPGSDPLTNLTRALATRRRPGPASAGETPEAIRALLEASSFGLVAAARQLLTDPADCLLVVADQFEELFRFRRIAPDTHARDEAAACVDLLINASQQDDVPVYVVLTMRSDYLGDCAQFTGLPEALNDSQFLVPRMTRAQLRSAIEDPIAVCGGRISPRLVQRLLYDVERRGSQDGGPAGRWDLREQDQLPVLQHALMRVWNISHASADRGEAIDLRVYEAPPVETLEHAIDRHAEEVFQALPTDAHREVARLIFQQLTDRDAENREVRRPTPLRELTAVALRGTDASGPARHDALVNDVVAAFAAEGRAFLVINAQGDVDISHESFIRNWERLRQWLAAENRSRRIYTRLVEAAASWEQDQGSLYRGPELAVARRWWREERPTQQWAARYDDRFALAQRFLGKSAGRQRLGRGLLIGNAVILIVGAIAITLLMGISRDQARRAEASALEARNAIEESRIKLEQANEYFQKALEAEKKGQSALAETLAVQGQNAQKQAAATPSVLTRGELAELSRLRLESAARKNLESPAATNTEAVAAKNTEAERRAIEQLVQQWARALTSRDIASISNIRSFTRQEAESWQRLYRNYKQIEVSAEVTGTPTVIEDQALVPVREILIMTQNNGIKITGQPRDTQYRMHKVSGQWRLLAPDAPMPRQ